MSAIPRRDRRPVGAPGDEPAPAVSRPVTALTPSAAAPSAETSPAQQRFGILTGQIRNARATLAAWEAQIPLFHRAYLRRVVPVFEQVRQARRASVDLVDALLDQPGWSKAEAAALQDWLLERAAECLATDPADTALRAIYTRHGGPDLPVGDPAAEPSSADGEDDEADDVRRAEEELAAREAHEAAARAAEKAAARAARIREKARRKASGAGAAAAGPDRLEAAQSLREVFRKLVSALHPDREADPVRRAEKTELMQQVNGAYAAQDLLGLLEIQTRLGQVDLQDTSVRRLEHYNALLAAQRRKLEQEIRQVQARFEADFGLVPGRLLHPDRLDRLNDEAYREVTALLAEQQTEIRNLTDRAATRRWLKAVRAYSR